jgi:hypothetical protein
VAIFPDWEDWRGLFATGFVFFVLALVFFVLPVTIGWILSLPFGPALGPFSRLPMIPGLLLGPPLTAAAVYRYQRRDELREALRIPALWRMIESTRMRLVVPTLALIGLVVVGVPLLPFVVFTGSAVVFSFYSSVFHHIEESRRMGLPRA